MLDNFSVHTSATITRVTILCSFAVVLLLALVKHNPIIACISVMFLLFGGLSYFGSLLYFAPLDFTHALVLFTALFVPFGSRRPARLVWIGATYGAAIAIFEILTGGIPTALALLALLTGISATDRHSLLQRFAILAFAFTVAVVTCFAIKLIAVSTVFDVNAFAVFQSALLKRIHGEIVPELAPSFVQFLAMHGIDAATYPIVVLIASYAVWSLLIGWGSSYFGVLLVTVGLLSLITSTVYLRRQRSKDAISPALISCWLSVAVVLAWVALFWNHTLNSCILYGSAFIDSIVERSRSSLRGSKIKERRRPPSAERLMSVPGHKRCLGSHLDMSAFHPKAT